MLKQYFSNRIKSSRQLSIVLVVLLVSVIGTYILTISHAASPNSSLTASTGMPANGAVTKTCSGSTASNGQCTVFACTVSGKISSCSLPNVSNDDGTTTTRAYQVYRPSGLTASQANKVPAILVFYYTGVCGPFSFGHMDDVADLNQFVVVTMEVPCGRDLSWDKKWVNSATAAPSNDEPYVTAVANDITQCPSSGAGPNQCVDPQRMYVAGESGGGNMSADVSCDPTNSTLFHGYLVDSSSVQLYNGTPGTPDCPSTNKNFVMMMALSNYSIDSGLYYDTSLNAHLDVPAFADWAAQRLGCTSTRVDNTLLGSNLRYSYFGPCANFSSGTRVVETLGVINGGHTWSCQDSDTGYPHSPTDVSGSCTGLLTTASPPGPGLSNGTTGVPKTGGLFLEQEFWNFVVQGT